MIDNLHFFNMQIYCFLLPTLFFWSDYIGSKSHDIQLNSLRIDISVTIEDHSPGEV